MKDNRPVEVFDGKKAIFCVLYGADPVYNVANTSGYLRHDKRSDVS